MGEIVIGVLACRQTNIGLLFVRVAAALVDNNSGQDLVPLLHFCDMIFM